MLFLYRPPQTWMRSASPRGHTQQAAYNRQLRQRFVATRRVAPTPTAARASTLIQALNAGVDGDRELLHRVLTDDVHGWTPEVAIGSLAELIDGLGHRDDVFSDIELVATPLDVGGDHACAEWSVALTHTGTLVLDDGTQVGPSGLRVTVHGATVADFRGERICSFRQYWDRSAVLEQLGAGRPPAAAAATPEPAN